MLNAIVRTLSFALTKGYDLLSSRRIRHLGTESRHVGIVSGIIIQLVIGAMLMKTLSTPAFLIATFIATTTANRLPFSSTTANLHGRSLLKIFSDQVANLSML